MKKLIITTTCLYPSNPSLNPSAICFTQFLFTIVCIGIVSHDIVRCTSNRHQICRYTWIVSPLNAILVLFQNEFFFIGTNKKHFILHKLFWYNIFQSYYSTSKLNKNEGVQQCHQSVFMTSYTEHCIHSLYLLLIFCILKWRWSIPTTTSRKPYKFYKKSELKICRVSAKFNYLLRLDMFSTLFFGGTCKLFY